jgi:hypothetical protein
VEPRERFRWLERVGDAEVTRIVFSEPGETLTDGDWYIDATSPRRGPTEAMTGEFVPKGGCYIVKSKLDPAVWDGVTAVARG